MPAHHHTIARNFRNHAGGRNAKRSGIAIDDCCLRERKSRDRQTVDKEMFRKGYQTGHGSLHGQVGRAKDVDLIDFRNRSQTDSEYNFGVRNQRPIIGFTSQT
jgi:hypothetical protein